MPVSFIVRVFFWLWFGAAIAAGHFLVLQRIPPFAVQGIIFGLTAVLLLAYFRVTPLRTSKDVESIRTYSHLHGLLPRLGFFADAPTKLPVDYDDVLRAAGSRPILVVAPTHDRLADLPALKNLLQPFPNVTLTTPDDFNRFTKETQTRVFDWIDRLKTNPAATTR